MAIGLGRARGARLRRPRGALTPELRKAEFRRRFARGASIEMSNPTASRSISFH